MKEKTFTYAFIALLFASFILLPAPVVAQEVAPIIVFDISHGQESDHGGSFDTYDANLAANLTEMGYTVVWAKGGINASILSDAAALIIGSIWGDGTEFLTAEITAIGDWFDTGNKFLWVGYDSDFTRDPTEGAFINDNSDDILEEVGSHVYGEPSALYDEEQNVDDQSYRVVSNVTSDNAFVADCVDGVNKVMTHSPTVLYYTATGTARAADAAPLEGTTYTNVYPVVYSSPASQIQDGDDTAPIAHDDGDTGSFVVMTVEIGAGAAGNSMIVVSGSKPYGGYHPMCDYEYAEEIMQGDKLVRQTIDWGITYVNQTDLTLILAIGAIGAIVVVVIIIAVMKKK